MYHLVELCLLHRAIARTLNDLLGFSVDGSTIQYQRRYAAERYRSTYERIRRRLVTGKLVHADETHFRLRGGQEGYVWALANMEDVYFFFTKTRECKRAKQLLDSFTGVLVSDFYSGYDSIPCQQQKCLIHLMRNLNDDLLKQPFNEELKDLATRFAELLRPMVETIDKYGLKKSKLKRHNGNVDTFYKQLSQRTFGSDVCVQYRDRFKYNRDRLFTFLSHDDVPWNNNNAEHAIKGFAKLRNAVEGLVSEVAINEYLVLLSVCVTCRYKGVGVLEFLRSGSEDVDAYIGSSRR